MSNFTLYHGDAIEVLKGLAANSIDATIIDPPYLTTDLAFDKAGLDMAWVTELLRVVKNNGYLTVFAPIEMLGYIASIWSMRFSGVWLKTNGIMRTHNAKKPMGQCEIYAVFAHPKYKIKNLTYNKQFVIGKPYKKVMRKGKYNRGGVDQVDRGNGSAWTKDGYICENDGFRHQTDVIQGSTKSRMPYSERTIHPTQKPLNVMEVLVQWLTNEGDTVLDCFMGSGTTGIACANTRRNFIGVELDPEYFALSQERITKANLGREGEIITPEPLPVTRKPKLQMEMF